MLWLLFKAHIKGRRVGRGLECFFPLMMFNGDSEGVRVARDQTDGGLMLSVCADPGSGLNRTSGVGAGIEIWMHKKHI